jgi:hypothetical protein
MIRLVLRKTRRIMTEGSAASQSQYDKNTASTALFVR